jgi:hypothetical protein
LPHARLRDREWGDPTLATDKALFDYPGLLTSANHSMRQAAWKAAR